MNPSPKYRTSFYDILPATASRRTELPAFPGALLLSDIEVGQRIKVINHAKRHGFAWNREAVFTVTDKPFKDQTGEVSLEVVFDRHTTTEHPDLPEGQYQSCCYKDVSAADLGLTPYARGHWNQERYCVEYHPTED